MQYVKLTPINLKNVCNERWVQDRITEDPSLLGLGQIKIIGSERMHAAAGRLDLLAKDSDEFENPKFYAIEIQLGKTDESHIIRTIEYWDIERKSRPNAQHVAVLIAEDITGRFFNVISLFNRSIPIIAIRLQALDLGDNQVALTFTKVLDETRFNFRDDSEPELSEPADRDFWERKSGKETLTLVDRCVSIVKSNDNSLNPSYKRHYIGLTRNGMADNFVKFHPKKSFLRCSLKMEKDDAVSKQLEDAGIDLRYSDREGYQFAIKTEDLGKNEIALTNLFRLCVQENAQKE